MSANTQRLVTHRDLHKTILGWLSPSTKQGPGKTAYDLTREHVPSGRSCRDAGIPDEWCNCFGRARPGDKRVHEMEGWYEGEGWCTRKQIAEKGGEGC